MTAPSRRVRTRQARRPSAEQQRLHFRASIVNEAAVALLMASLASLCALYMVANVYCGYSLCCFARKGRAVPVNRRHNFMRPADHA